LLALPSWAQQRKKKALFVWGGWEGHEPKKCVDIFAPWLEQQGFEVEISHTLDAYLDAQKLKSLDLIVQVYTMSQIEYVVDRVKWLHQHREKVKGLKFVEEPPVLRFFFGKLKALDNWGAKLAEAFKKEFGPNY